MQYQERVSQVGRLHERKLVVQANDGKSATQAGLLTGLKRDVGAQRPLAENRQKLLVRGREFGQDIEVLQSGGI
ncbi:MAG TPA: hypothetical protein VN673_14995, partial [Clostridia bacterium]|nr:hypothetical protein [Clostridia bacterium]